VETPRKSIDIHCPQPLSIAAMNLTFLFLIGYLAISSYYVWFSAQPSQACNPNSGEQKCAKPLFPPPKSNKDRERFALELWIIDEPQSTSSDANSRQSRKPNLEWRLLDSCPASRMTFNISDGDSSVTSVYSKHSFGGKAGNCTLTFPQFSRVRKDKDHTSSATPTILKGKFVLKQLSSSSQNVVVIAQTIFDLTRMVELERNSKVPHYKYSRQAIVLRLVADEQLYPVNLPVRGDGLKLSLYQPYSTNGTIYHRPTFYVDDVALKYSSQIQLAPPNENTENPKPPVTLSVKISIVSPLRHVLHRQLEIGFGMIESVLSPDELDEIRHMISDEYMYRFILTQIISFVHIYLDYMAFRDEVGFYVGKKSMGGISISSVVGRFVCQLIIFLYLCDGGNTSWLILGSVGSGVAVELWKVSKFFQPSVMARFPFISFKSASTMSCLERDTVNYDGIARAYLGLILYPLVFGSAIYAKNFYIYSSWWSWFISNLANAVYTFGFICLCPQLYVNYRLKSVAHLPMKVFVYKLFNTFVDDVFAFMIQMPLKHKLMTLRDDVVFIVFLVQAYIYRVDKSRTNEFGYAYDDEGENQELEGKEKERIKEE